MLCHFHFTSHCSRMKTIRSSRTNHQFPPSVFNIELFGGGRGKEIPPWLRNVAFYLSLEVFLLSWDKRVMGLGRRVLVGKGVMGPGHK